MLSGCGLIVRFGGDDIYIYHIYPPPLLHRARPLFGPRASAASPSRLSVRLPPQRLSTLFPLFIFTNEFKPQAPVWRVHADSSVRKRSGSARELRFEVGRDTCGIWDDLD